MRKMLQVLPVDCSPRYNRIHGAGVLVLTMLLAAPMTAQHNNATPTFTAFEAPFAGPGAGDGTFPTGINNGGGIVGYYAASGVLGAFARAADGTITSFAAPGGDLVTGTEATGVSAAGVIVGYYTKEVLVGGQGSVPVAYGFVRSESAQFITFSAPGAGIGEYYGTYPLAINGGTVTGYYLDSAGNRHGFVGDPLGVLTSFDPSPTGDNGEMAATSVNDSGTVTGYYSGGDFVRAADGTITSFTPNTGYLTEALSINAAGTVAGYYTDTNDVYHGFVRDSSGNITLIDAPGAGTQLYGGTLALSINGAGAIAGYYIDANAVNHAFVRAPDGAITEFEAPGADLQQANGGTTARSFSNLGVITGWFVDSTGTAHGFLLTP